MVHKSSEKKRKRDKEKSKAKLKKKRLDRSFECDTISLPADLKLKSFKLHADDISDEELKEKYLNTYAHPIGFGSYIDEWPSERIIGPPPQGHIWVACDSDTGEWIYYVQGKALQDEGINLDEAYDTIINLPYAVKANMATKRGCAQGNGFVGAMGIRYRYTEPSAKAGGREKVAPTASQNEALYNSILPAVQDVGNAIVRIVERWSVGLKLEMQAQRKFMRTVLPVSGTACHSFPMASIGIQGMYATHWDKRDTRTTLWGSLKYGGIALPAYRHVMQLSPGDVIGFNGKDHMHASVVFPCELSEIPHLPEELKNMKVTLYFQSQQGSYFLNAYNATHEDGVDKDGEVLKGLHSDTDDAHDTTSCDPPYVDTERMRSIAVRLGLMAEMRRNNTNTR